MTQVGGNGGVALWFERRSLTGELSLIYTPDLWLTCDLFVGKVSASLWVTQTGQLSLPSYRGQ